VVLSSLQAATSASAAAAQTALAPSPRTRVAKVIVSVLE
jgi:hypothetical protein